MKTYRPWEPDRTYLLPPSTRDWLPQDHLATFILEVIDELDLSDIEQRIQEKDPRGEKPYSPRMMTALLLYGYSTGIFASRALAMATWTDVGARVIAAEAHPHFTTINQFRLDHLRALNALFVQVLKLCHHAGLVRLGHVALDGTRIQANASKHKAMSYERMIKLEQRLQAEVDALLAKAAEADRVDDEQFGPDNDGNCLPEEIRRREARLQRLREAKAALQAEAAAARKLELEEQAERARAGAAEAPDEGTKGQLERRAEARDAAAEKLGADVSVIPGVGDGLPFHTVQHEQDGTPKPKAQRNFTDPDSRIMASNGTYVQAYNAQIVVDEENHIIVAQALTNQGPDVEHLPPMFDQVAHNLGRHPDKATADAGFWSEANGAYCDDKGIDAYISTRRRPHDEGDGAPTTPLPIAARTDAAKAMEAKVTTGAGKEVYSRRKCTVEPVFGEMKEARGFRRFRLRGLVKTRAEFSLVCTGSNLLKLWKNRKK